MLFPNQLEAMRFYERGCNSAARFPSQPHVFCFLASEALAGSYSMNISVCNKKLLISIFRRESVGNCQDRCYAVLWNCIRRFMAFGTPNRQTARLKDVRHPIQTVIGASHRVETRLYPALTNGNDWKFSFHTLRPVHSRIGAGTLLSAIRSNWIFRFPF